MTWELTLVIVVVVVCATALGAWHMWLVHLSEPLDEEEDTT